MFENHGLVRSRLLFPSLSLASHRIIHSFLASGFFEVYGTHLNPENMEASKEVQKGLPTLVYYSRKDAGTPKVSPKAGNM